MKTQAEPLTKKTANLSSEWGKWCKRGRYSVGHKRRAVQNCLNKKTGEVRGFYSDLFLDPSLPYTRSLYPSVEHTTFPKINAEVVVETRIINDMKSHLTDEEFWQIVEHLYKVGVSKGKVSRLARRHDAWKPGRNY